MPRVSIKQRLVKWYLTTLDAELEVFRFNSLGNFLDTELSSLLGHLGSANCWRFARICHSARPLKSNTMAVHISVGYVRRDIIYMYPSVHIMICFHLQEKSPVEIKSPHGW